MWPGRQRHEFRDKRGRVVCRLVEHIDGRRDVSTGEGWATARPADRERAAAWLADWFPALSHDDRYALLTGGII